MEEIKTIAEQAKIVKNDRKLIKQEDGKYLFVLNQEQLYTPEARENMLEVWKKEIKDKEEWLKNKDKMQKQMIKVAKKEVINHITNMETKIKMDITTAKDAIKIWGNPEGE